MPRGAVPDGEMQHPSPIASKTSHWALSANERTLVDVTKVGMVNELPDVPATASSGARRSQCPNCHAWEIRDRAFGFVAPSELEHSR